MVMKFLRAATAAGMLLLAACASGPRPYDGVIGYRATATAAGLDVSYVDEARVKPETVLRKLHAICAERLQAEPATVVVAVTDVEEYQQNVPMSVAVPVAMQANGSSSGGGGFSSGQAKSVIMQNEGVMRLMDLRKTSASCRKASAN